MSILLIDDSKLARAQLRGLLDEAGLKDCAEAEDAESALQLLQAAGPGLAPELILLDLVLPGMDGVALLKRLRALPGMEAVPVIVVTAQQDLQLIRRAFDAGATDFLLKPAREMELAARILAAAKLRREMESRLEREQELLEMTQKLEGAVMSLKALSVVDSLTGLYNRRHFDATLGREWRRAQREASPLALLMIDLDHFKGYNDHFGHQKGDECLRQVAQALKALLHRPGDMLARFGGEEFVALLPNTPPAGAQALAERLRQAVEALALEHAPESALRRVTISLGAASLVPGRGQDSAGLVKAADEALYQAKSQGRNCSVGVER
jgi:diguanylate cyclase (GGDEF)-like protein